MTAQAAGLILLACFCLGMLLGTTLTIQASQPRLRRQVEERRRLNAEWQAVREAQQSMQLVRCRRCGYVLPDQTRYIEEEDDPDDDD
jgi:Pyruvate/2-oxoacid:ferredoxin oxidoreductase delta subunit